MKVTWRSEGPMLAIIAAMFAAGAASWSSAPVRIPVHWDIAGEPDRYGGRFEGLFLLPIVAAGVYVLTLVLPRFDPVRANYRQFRGAYSVIRTAAVAVLAAVHALLVMTVRGRRPDIASVVPLVIGAMFVLLGVVMGKVRPNWFVGIRTPWTLSSKRSWVRTHRVGGWTFVAAGVVSIIAALWMSRTVAMVVFVVAATVAAIVPAVYSYFIWRDDPDRVPATSTRPAD